MDALLDQRKSEPTSPQLELLISQEEILRKVEKIGQQLNSDYAGKEVMVVMVMKGALCLTADLIRQFSFPCSLEFIQASSYGNKGTERGALTLTGFEKLDFFSKEVLLVDDIFDSGNTLTVIVAAIAAKKPKSLKTLVLLSKNIKRATSFVPDYVLFGIENRFVVGYGLDYKERYRGLPGVYILKDEG